VARGREVRIQLDLSEFTSRDRALELASEHCPEGYTAIAREHLHSTGQLWPQTLVFAACVSRARGLHEGCLTVISADNPHAALPLLRAYAELVSIIFYCLRRPNYVSRLSGLGI